jgi:hypothetical protein
MGRQPGDTETSRLITVRLSPRTHRALRIRVAEEDTSIQQWVEALIERELGVTRDREEGRIEELGEREEGLPLPGAGRGPGG